MSDFFKKFPLVLYNFGDETQPVAFQNLAKYSTAIDQISDQISSYIEYEIRDFDRPDSLSHQIYGSSEYDWTFAMMNPKIREQGWPLSLQSLYKLATTQLFSDWTAKITFTQRTADSASQYADLYPVNQPILINGVKPAIVKSKNIQLGEISFYLVDSSDTTDLSTIFVEGQDISKATLQYPVGEISQATIDSCTITREYYGTYEYRDPSTNSAADYFNFPEQPATPNILPITNLDRLIEENDSLKTIRVIKADQIKSVTGRYKNILSNE